MTRKRRWDDDNEVLLQNLLTDANDYDSVVVLLDELLTPKEKIMLQTRIGVTKALLEKRTYKQIEKEFGVSSYMVARISRHIVNAPAKYIVRQLGFSEMKLKSDV